MTQQQRNLFIMALVVLGIFGVLLVISARPNTAPADTAGATLDVPYMADGENRIVRLSKISQDVVSGARFMAGSSNAKLTVVEFADYQCPACGLFATNTESQFRSEFVDTGKVRYFFRDFPLPQHQNAKLAAQAASCALEQGRYEPFKAILFRRQQVWSSGLESTVKKQFAEYATLAGMNQASFVRCLDSNNAKTAIEADLNFGQELGVSSTPTFVVGDYMFAGALPIEAFRAILAKVGQ